MEQIEFVQVRSCPGCGSQDLRFSNNLKSREAQSIAGGTSFAINQCGTCFLLTTTPLPTSETLPYLYLERTSDDFSSSGGLIAKGRRNRLKREAEHYLSHLSLDGSEQEIRCLDWGCGDGAFSVQMAATGVRVTATDFHSESPFAADPSEFGVDYVPVTQLGSDHRKFDLIVARHALEHTLNPKDSLLELEAFLSPSGRLVISVPNARSLGARIFKRSWEGFYVPRHTCHWTVDTLKSFVEGNSELQVHSVTFASTPVLAGTLRNLLGIPVKRLGPVAMLLFALELLVPKKFRNTFTLILSHRYPT